MNNLLRFKPNQKYLSWDFETCNLNLLASEDPVNLPWQLGWQIYQGTRLLESHEDWLLWEDLESKMGKDAAALTGFDSSTYRKRAVDPAPIFDKFSKLLYSEDVINVGANIVNFDTYIFNILARKLGHKTNWDFTKRCLDIQILEKSKILNQKLPQIGTDEWFFNNMKLGMFHRRGMKTSLAYLCKMYGTEYNEFRHHKEAEYDCKLVMDVITKQINQIDV